MWKDEDQNSFISKWRELLHLKGGSERDVVMETENLNQI